MSQEVRRLYEFGHFRIDTVNRLLLRDGKPIALKPKAVDTLLVLIESSGRVVEKDELINKLWPDSFVEEGSLTQNIYELRKALDSTDEAESHIENIPRRGYRFARDVKELPIEAKAALTEERGESLFISGNGNAAFQESDVEGFQNSSLAATTPVSHRMASLPKRRILIVSILAGALLILCGYYLFSNRAKIPAANTEIKSLAILPFKPLSPEAKDEYMGQGMADALITKLSNSRQIAVRPTSAVLRYSSLEADPLAAGRELGVDVVLDGKLLQVGDRLRVTVQLLRVRDGASLWAEKFDEKFTDIFAVQDSISDQAARSLTLQLTGSERELMRKRYTENAEAYQTYLQGRYFWNKRNAAGFKKGIEYFQRAIEIDPNYAPAYAGLADCYIRLNDSGVPMAQESVPRGRAAVLKALEIDDTLAEAHATLAFIKFRHDWDFTGAEEEFKRSLQLDPNYSEAHQWYAFQLIAVGKLDDAGAAIKRAQELDPLSVSLNSNLALYLFFRHQFDQSIQQCQKTLTLEPNFTLAYVTLGLSYEQKGMNEEAIAEFKKAQELSDDAGTIAALGHALAKAGRVSNAREMLRILEERARSSYVPPYGIAVLHAGLGEKALALQWLERGLQDRSLRPAWLKSDPRLDVLRQEAEFIELIRRVGLSTS